MSTTSILGVIQHYQRSIEKCQTDEGRLLHCISKLYKLPIKVEHLQETGIGKTVNSLRKFDGEIGTAAKTLVAKWKAMVAAEEEPMETSCHQDDEDRKGNDSDADNDDEHNDRKKNTEINGNNIKHHSETKKTQPSSKDREHRGDVKQRDEIERNNKNSSSKPQDRSTGNSSQKESVRHKHENKSSHSSSGKDKNNTTDKHHKSQERNEKPDRKNEKPKDSHHETSDKKQDKQKNTTSSHKTSKHHKEEISHSNETHHHNSKRDKISNSDQKESSHHRENVKHENRSSSSSKEKDRSSQKHDSHTHENHKSSSKDDHVEKDEKHKSSSKDQDRHRDHDSRKNKHSSSAKNTSASPSPKTSKDKPSTSTEASSQRKRKHNSDQDLNTTKSPNAKQPKHNKVVEENNEDEDDEEGIDSSMGANFADVLGMLNMPGKKLKKSSNTSKSPTAGASTSSGNKSSSHAKDSLSSSSSKVNGIKPSTSSSLKKLDAKPDLLSSSTKLEPLDPSIAMELPTISTNYKPLPLSQNVLDVVFPSSSNTLNTVKLPARTLTDAEAITHGISSKTMRTKIYSGVRSGQLFQVPSLFDLCIRVLQKNIDALEYTGGVPFEVLRPVLERASPQQLLIFEEYNPYLMEDCDILWQQHVQRKYRTSKRQELESWREMFLRCQEEEDRKLNVLAESIKQSQKISSAPVRKTQLAFVDSMVKPPRNVQRKQEQFGTKSKLTATPAARVAALSSVTPNAAKTGDARLRVAASVRDNAQVASIVRPLKKAPLMAKTLQFMRGRHKR